MGKKVRCRIHTRSISPEPLLVDDKILRTEACPRSWCGSLRRLQYTYLIWYTCLVTKRREAQPATASHFGAIKNCGKRAPAIFFRTAAGGEPVRDWLKGLPSEDRKRIGEDIKMVE